MRYCDLNSNTTDSNVQQAKVSLSRMYVLSSDRPPLQDFLRAATLFAEISPCPDSNSLNIPEIYQEIPQVFPQITGGKFPRYFPRSWEIPVVGIYDHCYRSCGKIAQRSDHSSEEGDSRTFERVDRTRRVWHTMESVLVGWE